VAPFVPWQSFYVIVGSAAAALTGLQFVVMALISDSGRKGAHDTVAAFGTPTVVHFAVVLFTSAIIAAPWHSLTAPAVLLGICGLGGIAYAVIITLTAIRQTAYKPVLEDWIWHSVIPFVAYLLMLIGAVALARSGGGLYAIGATSLLLLFDGIHNAWDTVLFLATNETGSGTTTPTAGS
jgi:hypothetical protein